MGTGVLRHGEHLHSFGSRAAEVLPPREHQEAHGIGVLRAAHVGDWVPALYCRAVWQFGRDGLRAADDAELPWHDLAHLQHHFRVGDPGGGDRDGRVRRDGRPGRRRGDRDPDRAGRGSEVAAAHGGGDDGDAHRAKVPDTRRVHGGLPPCRLCYHEGLEAEGARSHLLLAHDSHAEWLQLYLVEMPLHAGDQPAPPLHALAAVRGPRRRDAAGHSAANHPQHGVEVGRGDDRGTNELCRRNHCADLLCRGRVRGARVH
mmetsp:Transcript_92863/g.262871  ORF Transcript_92863/g.262871 Transcript_92863/m.262871 type:complete len:259 (-) Transcript_92863:460-1236(-)